MCGIGRSLEEFEQIARLAQRKRVGELRGLRGSQTKFRDDAEIFAQHGLRCVLEHAHLIGVRRCGCVVEEQLLRGPETAVAFGYDDFDDAERILGESHHFVFMRSKGQLIAIEGRDRQQRSHVRQQQ